MELRTLLFVSANMHCFSPITFANPYDIGAVTPTQASAIPSVIGRDEFDYRARYARAQSYANAIFRRCIKWYVSALKPKSNWETPAEQHLKTVDIVCVVEETNFWGYYPNVRITELRYGSDSVARSTVLCMSMVSLIRPRVNSVLTLPTSSSPERVTKSIYVGHFRNSCKQEIVLTDRFRHFEMPLIYIENSEKVCFEKFQVNLILRPIKQDKFGPLYYYIFGFISEEGLPGFELRYHKDTDAVKWAQRICLLIRTLVGLIFTNFNVLW